ALGHMKKELPVWACLVVGLVFGLAFLAMGMSVTEPKLRRVLIAGGLVSLLLFAYGGATWAWGIHKRRIKFEDIKKSPEQINREADALLSKAADWVRRREHDDI